MALILAGSKNPGSDHWRGPSRITVVEISAYNEMVPHFRVDDRANFTPFELLSGVVTKCLSAAGSRRSTCHEAQRGPISERSLSTFAEALIEQCAGVPEAIAKGLYDTGYLEDLWRGTVSEAGRYVTTLAISSVFGPAPRAVRQ